MREEDKELIKLTVKQIMLLFCDITAGFTYLASRGNPHKKSMDDYTDMESINLVHFKEKIHYLKRKKLINIIIENKEKYLVPTEKGKKKIERYFLQNLKIKEFNKWDGKWRIVIFDVPKDKDIERDLFRRKLINFGFLQLQESVFIYPFECKEEIDFLKEIFSIKTYVQYVVAETIETEKDTLTHFFEKEILDKRKCGSFVVRTKKTPKK